MSFEYIHKLSFSLFINRNNQTICSFPPFSQQVPSCQVHEEILGGHKIWFIFHFHWMYYRDYVNSSQHCTCKSKPARCTCLCHWKVSFFLNLENCSIFPLNSSYQSRVHHDIYHNGEFSKLEGITFGDIWIEFVLYWKRLL